MPDPLGSDPFSGFGTIATGRRFVGRVDERNRLRERVASGGGSAALVGVARMGKSSLAAEVTRELGGDGRNVLWFDLSTYENGCVFFDEWAGMMIPTRLESSPSIHKAF